MLIIGGGPAGISAALWGAELGLSCCVIEAGPRLGGQLHSIYSPIRNYAGTAFTSGADCARRFQGSLEGRRIDLRVSSSVNEIDPSRLSLTTNEGTELFGRSVVIASGVRRRRLLVSGEDRFHDKGILDSGARDPGQVRGRRVAVIGGGDAALENALILSEAAERVFLIHRRQEFSAREEFKSAVQSNNKIEPILQSTVHGFGGGDRLSFVEVRDNSGAQSKFDVSRAIVRIGFQPNSEFVQNILETDEKGYITVDAAGHTSQKGIYAVGDVACQVSPTIASAAGSAATALKAIYEMVRNSE